MEYNFVNKNSAFVEGLVHFDSKDIVKMNIEKASASLYMLSLTEAVMLNLPINQDATKPTLRIHIPIAHKKQFLSDVGQQTLQTVFDYLKERYDDKGGKPYYLLDFKGRIILRSNKLKTKGLDSVPANAWLDGHLSQFSFLEKIYTTIVTHDAALILSDNKRAYIAWPRTGNTIIHLLAGCHFDKMFTPPYDVDAWTNVAVKAPAVYHHAKVNYNGAGSAAILHAIRNNGE